jgi:hypothetical protein
VSAALQPEDCGLLLETYLVCEMMLTPADPCTSVHRYPAMPGMDLLHSFSLKHTVIRGDLYRLYPWASDSQPGLVLPLVDITAW